MMPLSEGPLAEQVSDPDKDGGLVEKFDAYDVQSYCRELLRRITQMVDAASSPLWKWDILEFLEESRQQLRDARDAHAGADRSPWQEITEAIENEHTASTLPVGLRKQCEELLGRREMWLGDFDTEMRAILARGCELRERILFEDVDRASWFSASGVSPLEVQRLLERHLDMHQRAARLNRHLELLCRALRQQGAVSSRRRAFAAKTTGEKLQSSLVCLAAVAVAPVPGSSEMWLATTTMMWLDKDQAWQHVVYEHPRDADMEAILNPFQCHSVKERRFLASWLATPPAERKGCVLIHNASVRRIIVKTHLVNFIDGSGDSSADWTSALDGHPLGMVMKKALTLTGGNEDEQKVVIGAQRLGVVQLPPKPDTNWGWRGVFAYGDTKVGECKLREGGVFSFICVDCGLRVGDRESEGENTAKDPRLYDAATDALEDARQTHGSNGKATGTPLRADQSPADATIAEEKEAVEFENVFENTVINTEVGTKSPGESKGAPPAPAEEGPHTAVEVVNRTDEPLSVKIFEAGKSSHAARLFRSALCDGIIPAGANYVFSLKANPEKAETDFDVEIRVGPRRAKCEVAGGQVIFVDGLLADS